MIFTVIYGPLTLKNWHPAHQELLSFKILAIPAAAAAAGITKHIIPPIITEWRIGPLLQQAHAFSLRVPTFNKNFMTLF
jgi:hypothetical protein